MRASLNDSDNLGPRLPTNRKVMLVELCRDEHFGPNSSTTFKGYLLDVPELRHLGPLIEKMRVFIENADCTDDFISRVTVEWSISGKEWTKDGSASNVIGTRTTAGQTIGAYYTSSENFGPLMRYNVEIATDTDTVAVEGRVTAYLEITLKS